MTTWALACVRVLVMLFGGVRSMRLADGLWLNQGRITCALLSLEMPAGELLLNGKSYNLGWRHRPCEHC